jgi:hypothetical protein
MACPAVVSPEQDACDAAKGVATLDMNCATICSLPIAPAGKVAGFDFLGFHVAPSLAGTGGACPAVVSPEQAACDSAGGATSIDSQCRALCSKPIAHDGHLSGFDFDGLQLDVDAPGAPCPIPLRPELTACNSSHGVIVAGSGSLAKGGTACVALCSAPIVGGPPAP